MAWKAQVSRSLATGKIQSVSLYEIEAWPQSPAIKQSGLSGDRTRPRNKCASSRNAQDVGYLLREFIAHNQDVVTKADDYFLLAQTQTFSLLRSVGIESNAELILAWYLGVAAHTIRGSLQKTAMQRFLQTARMASGFALAFSMNSLHDFEASRRSQ
jgi:hypothetical protein